LQHALGIDPRAGAEGRALLFEEGGDPRPMQEAKAGAAREPGGDTDAPRRFRGIGAGEIGERETPLALAEPRRRRAWRICGRLSRSEPYCSARGQAKPASCAAWLALRLLR
jgi:hypothetical protein